jgi:LacI family transcriptional regulator
MNKKNKPLTIKDIANHLGVSIATVSYALNGKKKVSVETRNKILQLVAEVGYELNGAARDLKRQTSNLIAICLESLNGPFFSELISGIEQAATEANYQFIIATTYGSPTSSAYKILNERRVDGAIVLAPNLENDFLLMLADKGLPLVVLDRHLEHPRINSILLNNSTGIEEAIELLVAQNVVKIGYISGIATHYDSQQRSLAFHQALLRYGLTTQPEWMFAGNFRQDSGILAGKQLLLNPDNLPQAMICANDEMAIGLQAFLQQKHYKIPEQISIIGFDDILIARHLQPALSTISHPKFELGYLAIMYLLKLFNHEPAEVLQIETHFIQRQSSV